MKTKSLYLILATTAVVVTCTPQSTSNDIIWYPVDDEEGVFISTFGEKHRSSPKWRSHRVPRHSGREVPLPLSYDPSENYDPSFFNNINERRPYATSQTIPKFSSSFHNQIYSDRRPNKLPQAGGNDFQEIIIEVFDFNNRPPVNVFPGGRPNNQWNNRPVNNNQNQFAGNPFLGGTNQWSEGQRPTSNHWGGNPGIVSQHPGQRPTTPNKWGSTSGSPVSHQHGQTPVAPNQWGTASESLVNQYPGKRPTTSNQWDTTSGSHPFERPTNVEWVDSPSNTITSNRPNIRPTSNRPTDQSDKLIFPEETEITTPSDSFLPDLLPTEAPTRSPCENMCPVTPEFNPVCGTDSVTYSNAGRLKCAQMCGKDVRLSHYGNCGRSPLTTPLVSSNPLKDFRGFW